MLRAGSAIAIALSWGLPLVLGILFAIVPALNADALLAALRHPQFVGGLLLSLFTGTAALAGSILLAFAIMAGIYQNRSWQVLARTNALFLAIPHLAFAIGLGFLIMPSGLIARLIAQLFTGWDSPPDWVTTQDPLGLALIAALVLKETPFLSWAMWSLLARGDTAISMRGQWRSARGLGHGPLSIWLRLFAPQILRAIRWPLLAVWVYGATVVDMALVIGPTQPPTYAVVAWNDLNDAETAINMRGAADALLLTGALALAGMAALILIRLTRGMQISFATRGPQARALPLATISRTLLALVAIIYMLVVMVLFIMSFGAQWPFPQVLPVLQLRAWQTLMTGPAPFLWSLAFGFVTALSATGLAVLWLEAWPPRHDRILTGLAILALTVPQIVIAGGQYFLLLRIGLTGSAIGVALAHFTPVFAYAVVILQGSYRAFDDRFRSVSLGLNCSPARFWLHVKAPLLRPALAATAAVGFAVSMGQYLPAQLVGSGRITTLPVEAVTLASGGNRALLAVFALALLLPPALAFLAAQHAGRTQRGFA